MTMNAPRLTRQLLRLDAGANVGVGIASVAGAGFLTRVLVLPNAGIFMAVGLLCAANAFACWRFADAPSPAALRGLAAVDLGFAVAVAAFALLDPTATPTAARWALVALADTSALVGVAKLFLAARLARSAGVRPVAG